MATQTPKPMVQDGYEYREMTEAEFAQYEIDQAANIIAAKAQADKATAKQVVLDRLGITADEARMLLS